MYMYMCIKIIHLIWKYIVRKWKKEYDYMNVCKGI